LVKFRKFNLNRDEATIGHLLQGASKERYAADSGTFDGYQELIRVIANS